MRTCRYPFCLVPALFVLVPGANARPGGWANPLLVPVSQERTTEASGNGVGAASASQSEEATDFGPFHSDIAAISFGDTSDGEGWASQDSEILDDALLASGDAESAADGGGCLTGGGSAIGEGSSTPST